MIIELEDGGLLVTKTMAPTVEVVGKQMVAMVSTDSVDSDGDIIHQGKNPKGAGWDLSEFNKNPILTWGHDRFSRPNIGSKDVRAKVGKRPDGGRALFLEPFAFDMPDPFAADIAGKYERGVLRQTSVGFVGKVWDRRMEGDSMVGREYFEQKLLEVAAVNIGANQETDIVAKAMLTNYGLAAKVQAGGSHEIAELKDEIAELVRKIGDMQTDHEREIQMLANAIKRFGEDSDGQQAADVVSSARNKAAVDLDAAATAILLALRRAGAAY